MPKTPQDALNSGKMPEPVFIVDATGSINNGQKADVIMDQEAFYATVTGGTVLFSAASGSVNITTTPAPVLTLTNPSGSGKVLYIANVYVSSSVAGTCSTIRNPTGITGGAAVIPNNRGQGVNSSVATAKTGTTAISYTGGTTSKVRFLAGNMPDDKNVRGTTTLAPGQSFAWSMAASAGTGQGTVNVIWWEI